MENKLTIKQERMIHGLIQRTGKFKEAVIADLKRMFSKESISQLTIKEASAYIDAMQVSQEDKLNVKVEKVSEPKEKFWENLVDAPKESKARANTFKTADKIENEDKIVGVNARIMQECYDKITDMLGHKPQAEEIAMVNSLYIQVNKSISAISMLNKPRQ